MQELSKKSKDNQFSKRFLKGFLMAVGAAMVMAIILVIMGMVAFYGQKYNW